MPSVSSWKSCFIHMTVMVDTCVPRWMLNCAFSCTGSTLYERKRVMCATLGIGHYSSTFNPDANKLMSSSMKCSSKKSTLKPLVDYPREAAVLHTYKSHSLISVLVWFLLTLASSLIVRLGAPSVKFFLDLQFWGKTKSSNCQTWCCCYSGNVVQGTTSATILLHALYKMLYTMCELAHVYQNYDATIWNCVQAANSSRVKRLSAKDSGEIKVVGYKVTTRFTEMNISGWMKNRFFCMQMHSICKAAFGSLLQNV